MIGMMTGMTEERLVQLKDNPELKPAAVEEIWSEMLRLRKRLHEIRQAHYLIYDWEYVENSGDMDAKELEARRNYLIAIGVAVTQPEKGGE